MITLAKTLSSTTKIAGFALYLMAAGCTASTSTTVATSPQEDNTTYKTMGPLCKTGRVLFYGKVIDTGAEERLCEVKGDTPKWYFWTRSGHSNEIIGTEVTHVQKVFMKGKSGYTVGYDFTLGADYKVGFRAAYYEKDNVLPVQAFFLIDGEAMPVDIPTVVVKH